MKRCIGVLALMGFTIAIGVGVVYSQGSSGGASPSVQEALEKAKAADANKDYAEAGKWYRMAAEQGNAEAQCHVGNGLIGNAMALALRNVVLNKTDDTKVASLTKEGLDWLLTFHAYARARSISANNIGRSKHFRVVSSNSKHTGEN